MSLAPVRKSCLISILTLGSVFAIVQQSLVAAQGAEYTTAKVDPKYRNEKGIRSARLQKNKAVTATVWDKGNQKRIDEYYDKFFWRAITDVKFGGHFGEMRIGLQKDLATARTSEARQHIIKIIMRPCVKIAKTDSFHPMARYNAILILSDLNAKEGTRTVPAAPDLRITRFLSDQLAVDKPDVVQLAALIGLQRHVQLLTHPAAPKFDTKKFEKLALRVTKLYAQRDLPAGQTEDGHDWIRGQAAALLGDLGLESSAGELWKVVANDQESVALRCHSAESLGKLNLAASKSDPQVVAGLLGKLAVSCAQLEVDYILEEMGEGSREGPGSRLVSSREGGMDDDEIQFVDPRTVPLRRRLLARLAQVNDGLGRDADKGVRSIAGGQESAENTSKEIQGFIDIAQDPSSALMSFGKELYDEIARVSSNYGDVKLPSQEPAAEEPAAEEPAAEKPAAE